MTRVGVVGTGWWAREIHARGIRTSGLDLAGFWGRDLRRTQAAATELSVTAYPTYEDLLADVDVVSFSVPPQVQVDMALLAAQAGKALLLEKPVALESAAAEALEREVNHNGVSVVVFHTHLFVPSTGAWLRARAVETRWDHAMVEMTSSVLTYDNQFSGSPWRHQNKALWDLGPHALSIVLSVLGDIEEVSAIRGRRDMTSISLRHEGGAVSTLLLSLESQAGDCFEMRLLGPERRNAGSFSVPTPETSRSAYMAALRALVDFTDPRRGLSLGVRVVAALSEIQRLLLTKQPRLPRTNY